MVKIGLGIPRYCDHGIICKITMPLITIEEASSSFPFKTWSDGGEGGLCSEWLSFHANYVRYQYSSSKNPLVGLMYVL